MVWSIKFIKYRENKMIVTQYVQNVRLWFKHKLAGVLAIGQLYHQSVTAPSCTTQLRDVHDLPLPVRRSSKPVSCTFLDNFYSSPFSVFIRTLPNQTQSTVAFWFPLLSNQNGVFFSISFKYLPFVYLSLHDNDVMFMPWIKKERAYLQRVFIPVFRYVKVTKIHQDFPELWLQMYCHLFLWFTV